MKYFTADLHLNHKAILAAGKGRPFNTLEEMQEVIISKWNRKVASGDDVYVLGDMFWGLKDYQIQKIMDRLHGKKHLIIGNHDQLNHNINSNRWAEIVESKILEMHNTAVVLTHHPQMEWDHYYYDSYHLYGHVHGTLNLARYTMLRPHKNMNCWDVGVDNNNFEPVSFEEIKVKIKENIERLKNGKDI